LGGAEASRLNRGIEVMTARAGLRIAIIFFFSKDPLSAFIELEKSSLQES
jgi:hypothetical protein